MKATIQDSDVLQSIGPSEIASYLRGNGWRFERQYGPNGALWAQDGAENRKYEILLPVRQDLDDYARRLAEVLQTLEIVEERSQLELLRDINDAQADVVRLRLQGENLGDGSVPLESAARIVSQAREMMLAAACAAVQPRQAYRTKKPDKATEYMQGVRLGQTERGSYVLAIRSLVPPRLTTEQTQESETEEPFERRVTLKLAEALQATSEAVKQGNMTGNVEPFQNAVEKGVSANLCEAIARLTEEGGAQVLALSVNWSPARWVSQDVPRSFRFTADASPLLKEVAKVFRDREPYGAFELRGAIVKLERGPDDVEGDIIVPALVEGSLRKIAIRLDADAYQTAVKAHGDGRPIYAEGELTREGRSYRLLNPRNLAVTDYE